MCKLIKLYYYPLSGHSHKVELLLSLLDLKFEKRLVNPAAREQKRPEFIALNPFGQVPVIDDDGVIIYDSNAILVYLANKYDRSCRWLPKNPLDEARIQRWLSIAAGQIASGPCAARLFTVFNAPVDTQEAILKSYALFKVIEQELMENMYLIGRQPTIADIACYTYIAHAPEGNISLNDYPNIQGWLSRIESIPGFVPMQQTAVGLLSS